MAGKTSKSFVTAGPNIPPGSSRPFIDLIKAIGEAGSNHVCEEQEEGDDDDDDG